MSDDEKSTSKRKPVVIRNTIDLQRLKLEKLMKNPDKAIIIPEKPKERGIPAVPDFVRNVMGSSAGAGSGEFHVYRHLRRKEYARQRYMKAIGEKEKLDNEYKEKLETYKKLSDEKTAKRREKRLKKKKKQKSKSKKPRVEDKSDSGDESESSADEEACEVNKDPEEPPNEAEENSGTEKTETETEKNNQKEGHKDQTEDGKATVQVQDKPGNIDHETSSMESSDSSTDE